MFIRIFSFYMVINAVLQCEGNATSYVCSDSRGNPVGYVYGLAKLPPDAINKLCKAQQPEACLNGCAGGPNDVANQLPE